MASNNVLVNNLCGWPLYFKRIAGVGDITIPPNAKKFPLLSFEEVQAQIQVGNVLFTGTNGMGDHARIQIVDDEQRKQLFGIENVEVEAPSVLDLDAVKALLAMRSKAKFDERLKSIVQTDAEKRMLVELAEQAGASDSESWKMDAIRSLAETAKL